MGRGNWMPLFDNLVARYVYIDRQCIYPDAEDHSYDSWYWHQAWCDFENDLFENVLSEHWVQGTSFIAKRDINCSPRARLRHNSEIILALSDEDPYCVVCLYMLRTDAEPDWDMDEDAREKEQEIITARELGQFELFADLTFDTLDEYYELYTRNGAWMSKRYTRTDGSESHYKPTEVTT